MRASILVCCLAILPEIAVPSPPPPPPEYIDNIARELVENLTPQTFKAYSANFADNLRVFVDGRELAADRKTWLTLERDRLGKFSRRVIGYAEGQDNILVVDEFDDISGCPANSLCDPRLITRAARYKFGPDHLIHELRFVQGGDILIPPSSK
jgi:hypothetical protein